MRTRDWAPIALVSELAGALEEAGVAYCHWKSNSRIEYAERGEDDLDLLVAQEHAAIFNEVLASFGFIAARRPSDFHIPGTAHYFSYDRSSDRLVHVHAHYRLVLGHDRSKNYVLPIEGPFIASAAPRNTLPVPAPEFEYVVFVIRMVLKYAVWDEVLWQGLRLRRASPSDSESDEWIELKNAVDPRKVARVLAEHLPFLAPDMFVDLEDVVDGNRSAWRALVVGWRLESNLANFGRLSPRLDGLRRLRRRLGLSFRRRVGTRRGFQPSSGGVIVAVMGGDGAGKSTAVQEITEWLGSDFDVVQTHLGKPPWSWTTYLVRGSLMLVHRLSSLVRGASRDRPSLSTFEDYRRAWWLVCIARDRYLTYRSVRRQANRGSIVISDRYPHPALRVMDVAQIERLFSQVHVNRLLRRLSKIEGRYHSRISAPEIAVVLVLDPDEAARRKTDEPYDYVLKRSAEIWDTSWSGTGVKVVDASQSPQAVGAELKSIIWDGIA